jgi:integrase
MRGKLVNSDRNPEIEAAKILLQRIGITVDDLAADSSPVPTIPTFDEYIPQVAVAVAEGTRKVYETYWNRVLEQWGHRRLDEPTPTEIEQLGEYVKAIAVVRRNSRGGRSAVEHLVASIRCLYRHAENDGLVNKESNPSLKVSKPGRLETTRRALTARHLDEIYTTANSTGNDPTLDTIILRLHAETACRRGGALGLREKDINTTDCTVYLQEKAGTARWQPVSPSLTHALVHHIGTRGGFIGPGASVLRYMDGRPIGSRRYDYVWTRLGKHLPWVAAQQVSTHWLRHTTLTWVERNFGYATARAFAGHMTQRNAGTTATYVKASLYEVAAALSALTGEPHPLSEAPP